MYICIVHIRTIQQVNIQNYVVSLDYLLCRARLNYLNMVCMSTYFCNISRISYMYVQVHSATETTKCLLNYIRRYLYKYLYKYVCTYLHTWYYCTVHIYVPNTKNCTTRYPQPSCSCPTC